MRIFGGNKAKTERRMGEQYQAQTGSNFQNYVAHNEDLNRAYDRIASNWGKPLAEMNPTERDEMRYWKPRMGNTLSKGAFGKAHYGENQALAGGNYIGQTQFAPGDIQSRDIAQAGQTLPNIVPIEQQTLEQINAPGAGFVNPMTQGFLNYEPAQSGLLASNPLTKFEQPEFTQWQARPGVLPDWDVVNPAAQQQAVTEETETTAADTVPDWQDRWLQQNQYINRDTGQTSPFMFAGAQPSQAIDSYNALKAMQVDPNTGERLSPLQSLKTSVTGLSRFMNPIPAGLLDFIRGQQPADPWVDPDK